MKSKIVMLCPCCAKEVDPKGLWVDDGKIYHYSCYNIMMEKEDEDSEKE